MNRSFEHIRKRLNGFRFRSVIQAAKRCRYTEPTMWRMLGNMTEKGFLTCRIDENGWLLTFHEKPFFSAGETAAALDYSIQRIGQLCRDGEVKGAFRNASGWQIPAGWVDQQRGREKEKPGPKTRKYLDKPRY